MSGETLGANSATTDNGWDSLANYRPPVKAETSKEVTFGSVVKNAGERAATSAESFLDGWSMAHAQKKAERVDDRADRLSDKNDRLTDRIDAAQIDFNEASDAKDFASENFDDLSSQLADQKEELAQDKKEYSVGNYLKTQSEQIGAILKSEKGVVKNALNAFKAKIITKIPHIEISIKTDEQIASSNWQEQLRANSAERNAARTRIESAKDAQSQFESAKAARAEAIAGLGRNKETYRDGRNEISNLRKELADTKKELSYAKAEKQKTAQEFQDAEQTLSDLNKQQERLAGKMESLATKREEEDKKIAEFQAKANRLEALSKFQQEIGSKSPARMRANIEKQLADIQEKRDDKLEDMLFMKGVDSIDELSAEDVRRVQKRLESMDATIATLEAQRDALDQYENLRQEKTNKVLSNPTAKKGVRGAFRALRNATTVFFF